MHKIIKHIKSNLSKDLEKHIIRKKQVIYIPFAEIGIECLTRNESKINLFYETTLKCIDIGVCNINEIAEILGVTYDIVKEVIIDMIRDDFIVVSANLIKMTPLGRNSLDTGKSVTIKKGVISNIAINLITGEIKNIDKIEKSKVKRNDVCLNQELTITKEFLNANYFEINKLFQENQFEEGIFSNNRLFQQNQINKNINIVTDEIYKILDIAYYNLTYVKNELLLYENEDSKNFHFAFSNDKNEHYLNCFHNQIKETTPPCLENFFERNYSFAKQHENCIESVDLSAKKITEELRIVMKSSDNVISDKMYYEFKSRRYMLEDSEYKLYFEYFNDVEFEKMIIITNRINSILDDAIINNIVDITKKCPTLIAYNDSEFNSDRIIALISEKSEKSNFTSMKNSSISETIIYFYPNVMIKIGESVTKIFDRPVTFKKGLIDFDESKIIVDFDNIQEKYNLKLPETKKQIQEIKSASTPKRHLTKKESQATKKIRLSPTFKKR